MRVVILGGTGTLGSALVQRLAGRHHVTVFSRDELKQQEMRRRFPNVDYVIGDIRDKGSLREVMPMADVVFHVAALKHVDVLEANVAEAIKTNVIGTMNVADVATDYGIDHVVFSTTDKAVLPINTYGMSKGLAERHLFSLNERQSATKFSVFAWGNVLGSRGSVLHQFAKSLRERSVVQITDDRMTRFWIHIEDAVSFMLESFKVAPRNRRMIPPMKAASVAALAHAVAETLGVMPYRIERVGIRPGEKIHECIESSHERCIRSDNSPLYTPEELRALVERSLA